MASREALKSYTQSYLNADAFEDYCPNGLQIEGKEEINKIISGVSANLALIERAIDEKADAIFVHHGLFWKNDSQTIRGAKRRKIALLLENNINLFAYHLPLDAHPDVGNNVQLGKLLGINIYFIFLFIYYFESLSLFSLFHLIKTRYSFYLPIILRYYNIFQN